MPRLEGVGVGLFRLLGVEVHLQGGHVVSRETELVFQVGLPAWRDLFEDFVDLFNCIFHGDTPFLLFNLAKVNISFVTSKYIRKKVTPHPVWA